MKTRKTSRLYVFQTPTRCRICKSVRYLAQLSKKHTVVYKTFHKDSFQISQQDGFQDNSKRHLENIFARYLLEALKMLDLQIQKTSCIAVLKTSRLVLHKTLGKNVSKASCKTDTFGKSGSKTIAKLVNGFKPLTIFVKKLHRKSSTEF